MGSSPGAHEGPRARDAALRLLHDKFEVGGKLQLVDETADDEVLWKRLEELATKRRKPESA